MKRNILYIIIAVVVVIAISAYFFVTYQQRREYKHFVNAVADVYMLDAVIQQKGGMTRRNSTDVEQCYHTLLSHYGMTKTEFDTIMVDYARDPERYSQLYHNVVEVITRRQTSFDVLYNRLDSVNKRIDFIEDSIKVTWLKEKIIRLPLDEKDSVPKDLTFKYETDSLVGGHIYLSMKHNFPHRNKAKEDCEMRLLVTYNDTILDTIETKIVKKTKQELAEVVYQVSDSQYVTSVEAVLLTSKDLKNTTANLNDIKFYYLPFDPKDSVEMPEIIFPPLFPF